MEPQEAAGPGSEPLDRSAEVERFLLALTGGDPAAPRQLLPIVYTELRNLAETYLRGERVDHTLQPTALVHEAWLRLVDQSRVDWQDRAHFLGIAALAMRRVLVDHARSRLRAKRGGGSGREELWTGLAGTELGLDELDILALHEGLDGLAEKSQRGARIVELRFFGGLTTGEIARVLDVTPRTVEREWAAARAWLAHRLHGARE